MSNLVDCSATSWICFDPDLIRRELEASFPGVRAWLGEYTGHWWALANGRLVEAATPRLLADKVRKALAVRRTVPSQGAAVAQASRPGRESASPAHARAKRRRLALFGGGR